MIELCAPDLSKLLARFRFVIERSLKPSSKLVTNSTQRNFVRGMPSAPGCVNGIEF
jgi:hypothetical protein